MTVCELLVILSICAVADFGFARYLTGADMAATLCGSPLYMVKCSTVQWNMQARGSCASWWLWGLG